jgi:hypothetical protein
MKNGMKGSLLVVLAFSLLLVACDKELPDKKLSGKEVLVRVRLVGVAEGKEADVARSASMQEPETMGMPLGDGMVLEMRMEQDSSALRATTSQLDEYARFRVVAVIHGTSTFISYGDFTIHDGIVEGGLHVPDNDSYDFICYSYNTSNALPALSYAQGGTIPESGTINVLQGTNDLLYKKIVDIPVSGSAPELEILLERVMARMQVVIDCSYNNWAIASVASTITLGSVYSGGTVRLTDKVVASNSGTPTFSSWTGSGTKRESNGILVMPKGSGTLTVSIPASAINTVQASTIPRSVATATFSTALDAGYSYKLFVKLKKLMWAGSNIYFDGSGLTFDVHYADGSSAPHRGYQGVLFKWGSLVGISPAGAHNSALPSDCPLYIPNASGSGWAKIALSTTGYTWKTIPHVDATNFPVIGLDNEDTYLIDAARNNPTTMYAYYRGDICQFLGTRNAGLTGYRMPKAYEILGTAMVSTTFSGGQTPNDTGTANMPGSKYWLCAAAGNLTLPLSGGREDASGSMTWSGTYAYYWAGSAGNAAANAWGWELSFKQALHDTYSRHIAFPVRCIKA